MAKVKKIPKGKIAKAKKRIVKAGESFKYLRMLVYGKNGVGKTRFGATGPKPIVVDCNEKGTLTIRKFKQAEIFPLEAWSDIDLIYWYLKKGDHDRETVVIDNMTSLASLCMDFVMGEEVALDPTLDPTMPTKQHWGKVAMMMRTEILKFRNLPMHVVFLAQEKRGFSDDDDEDAPEVFPEVSPSVRKALTAAVDIIGRMYVKEVTKKVEVKGKKKKVSETSYRMLVGASERYVTKDRSNAGLPRVLGLGDGKDNLTKLVARIKAAK